MSQLTIFDETSHQVEKNNTNQTLNVDLPIHRWYQFVLGYPPHLVQYYLEKFNINKDHIVLDPFCGTGTTNVECLKNRITNYGVEGNLFACFASQVKTTVSLNIDELRDYLGYICQSLCLSFEQLDIKDPLPLSQQITTSKTPLVVDNIPTISSEKQKLIPKGFISPKPLQKVLIAKEIINTIRDTDIRAFFILSLANVIVKNASNIGFGPEIYQKKAKDDVEFLSFYTFNTLTMLEDLRIYNGHNAISTIIRGDARKLEQSLSKDLFQKVDCVITSPPYPNEKDYTRSTRLESVLLDFLNTKKELRHLKEYLLRSNSRNIFVSDRDGENIKQFQHICELADEIEEKRIALKKNSGFEKQYHKIVRHYFGGMFLHLRSLKPFLAKHAKLAYVVGDQMSFFRTLIPTAALLAEIAEYLGFNVLEIELWRRRLATATKQQIDENVLILENLNGI